MVVCSQLVLCVMNILQSLKEHQRLYCEDGKWIRLDVQDAESSTSSSSMGISLPTEGPVFEASGSDESLLLEDGIGFDDTECEGSSSEEIYPGE